MRLRRLGSIRGGSLEVMLVHAISRACELGIRNFYDSRTQKSWMLLRGTRELPWKMVVSGAQGRQLSVCGSANQTIAF